MCLFINYKFPFPRLLPIHPCHLLYPSEKGRSSMDVTPTLAYQVALGLGATFPSEHRQSSPARERGPRQTAESPETASTLVIRGPT